MRYLDRANVPPPACLAQFQHGRDNWGAVDAVSKAEIRAHLEQLQGRRCSYCEGSVDTLGQHIEHLRSRHRFPVLTFVWENLYWSCNQDDSCGRHKDNGADAFDINDVIDPCAENPDRYFRFRSDGTIETRADLTAAQQHRATETLRVFNLDPEYGRLRSMRARVLEVYLALESGILEALATFSLEERGAFIDEELLRTAAEPFSTVIRHFFEAIQ